MLVPTSMPAPLTDDPGADDGPSLRLLVVCERGVVDLGLAHRVDRCGLGFVEDLLRLRLALGRFGWALVLADVPEEVAELFALVGLAPGRGDQSSR